MHWVYIFCVILLAAVLKGLTGFGFALLAMPLLIFIFPVKLIIPLLTFFNLFSSTMIVLKRPAERSGIRALILPAWGVVGLVPGVLFLHLVEEQTLRIFAGIMLSLLALAFLLGYRYNIRKPARATMISGMISGFLGGSISVSGPPLAFFLTSMNTSNENFRNKFAWFNVFNASIALVGYYTADLIVPQNMKMALYLLPVLVIGTIIGQRLSSKVPVALFRKICIWISFISGLTVLVNTLMELM